MTETNHTRLLVVVRCGDHSLHKEWAVGSPMFHIAVSYFGSDLTREFPEATYIHRKIGGKWDGIYSFFDQFPETLSSYEFFWFPDDDISASAAQIEALISAGVRHELDLFQPSLDNMSYYSHLITLHHPSFVVRYTNFVEIMVPVLSRRLLVEALPTMRDTKSGFGLDFLWPQMARALDERPAVPRVAIVDAVRVRHTRPVGGSLHAFIKKTGCRSSREELSSIMTSLDMPLTSQISGVPTPRVRNSSGMLHNGKVISSLSMAVRTLIDLVLLGRNQVQPFSLVRIVRHSFKVLDASLESNRKPSSLASNSG